MTERKIFINPSGPCCSKHKLCTTVHRQDLDLLLSEWGGRRGGGGGGERGHLHLITATSAPLLGWLGYAGHCATVYIQTMRFHPGDCSLLSRPETFDAHIRVFNQKTLCKLLQRGLFSIISFTAVWRLFGPLGAHWRKWKSIQTLCPFKDHGGISVSSIAQIASVKMHSTHPKIHSSIESCYQKDREKNPHSGMRLFEVEMVLPL